MKYYVLLTFFPIYYSLINWKRYLQNRVTIRNSKNDSSELEKKTYRFLNCNEGYDNRINTTDVDLNKIYDDLFKMGLLKILENKDISIYTKLSLISYHDILNVYPQHYIYLYSGKISNGGLLDDWDFI